MDDFGPRRGRPPLKEPRSAKYTVRFTEREAAIIRLRAQAVGKTHTTWIRDAALEKLGWRREDTGEG